MFHVKHITEAEVHCVASEVGVILDERQAELIAEHGNWLVTANLRVNLTAITEYEKVLRLHIADSLAALPEVVAAPVGKMIDLGTGGGFPGFPLSVASGREAVLLDSTVKKSRILSEFLSGSGWERATAVAQRAEDHAREYREAYMLVVARAVAELPSLLELASPLLEAGGRLVALKGVLSEAERSRALEVRGSTGMGEISERTLALPGGEERRTIVVVKKVGDAGASLPRRTGLAQSRPLA